MRLWDNIVTGLSEIRAHKLRSFLSFFAIAIGIATFFYTLSILSQNYRRIEAATVSAGGEGRLDLKENNHPMNLQQYQELQQILPPGASLSFKTYWGFGKVIYQKKVLSGNNVYGILPTWTDSRPLYKLEGRFLNWHDINNHHRVAILVVPTQGKEKREPKHYWWQDDESVLEKPIDMGAFIERHNLLHQQLLIADESFTVIGLLHAPAPEEDPRFGTDKREDFQWNETSIFIPFTTWYDIQPSWRKQFNTHIRIITPRPSDTFNAGAKLSSYLRSQYGTQTNTDIEFFKDEIENNKRDARRELNKMFFLGLIAMIAGGIGIMNVTMAVIFSRTREIGIRRALGATRKDILVQFLIEAMLLGLCGAVAGMILGYLAVLHLAENTQQMTFSWWVVALSILMALFTSFLFALYPAYQAAKMKPVEALKQE